MATIPSAAYAPEFTPAITPSPGVTPNPDHPASLLHVADITIGIIIPFVTIFFALRTYVRVHLKRVWLLEDCLVTIGWAGTIAFCAIMRATMTHNGGKHGWDITAAQAHEAAYWFHIAAIEYGFIICATKVAVLLFYRRIFSPIRRSRFDNTILTLIIVMASFYGITSFLKIFECNPRAKIWNRSIPGKCMQMRWILNISGGFNMLTDYFILLLPLHMIHKLKISQTKKILVALAFTFGLCPPVFATIGFIVRLKNTDDPDITWKQHHILPWGAAELASGTLCVCFPELTILFRKQQRKNVSRPRRATISELEGIRMDSHPKRLPLDPYATSSMVNTYSTAGKGLNLVIS